ncbi:PD-(D/E)XK nuclease-like domain-containing protein [Actinoplanes sp. NPDC051851]|uniref:PD-(D/E)XK nuclease-like domain-containing protein n=1 Tax=Actinoplanes sp. NPDC051851 TaxID=3154753 RepID=UPI0034337F2F
MTVLAATAPGVYPDMPEDVYHRDLAASSTVLKALLKDPAAKVDYQRRNPSAPKRAFDLGSAAHTMLLGRGSEIVEVPFADYRKKDAQALRDAAYDADQIPLLTRELAQVQAMAGAVRQHPDAGVFIAAPGDPELSIWWTDPATGVPCRARFDKAIRDRRGRLVIVDVKTTIDASDYGFGKAAASFGYHQQEAHYTAGAVAVGLDDDPGFVFIAVEKDPPHLVNVVQLDGTALETGRRRNERALAIFAECTATGVWPGYPDGITEISLPSWATREDTW